MYIVCMFLPFVVNKDEYIHVTDFNVSAPYLGDHWGGRCEIMNEELTFMIDIYRK